MLSVEVSERVSNLFGRMPPVDEIKKFCKYLSRGVMRVISENAIELQSALVEANCKYVELKNSLVEKIKLAKDFLAIELLGNNEDSEHTLNSLRRAEHSLGSLEAEFERLSNSKLVTTAEVILELYDSGDGADPEASFDQIPDSDDEDANDFRRLVRYLAEEAGYQELADEPMPPLELGPPLVPVLPPVPQVARRSLVVVDSDEEPDVPLPLRMVRLQPAAQEVEDQKDPEHFMTDARSCRRRILVGRAAKTHVDQEGVIRLNTRTVEAHLSRNARRSRYGPDGGLVRILNMFKTRIEDRIETLFGDRCAAVSLALFVDIELMSDVRRRRRKSYYWRSTTCSTCGGKNFTCCLTRMLKLFWKLSLMISSSFRLVGIALVLRCFSA